MTSGREIDLAILGVILFASLVLGAWVWVWGTYFAQVEEIGPDSGTAITPDNQNIGNEEHLYLPINVTRISGVSLSGSMIFKYESRGDEELILYLIGGQREKEVQNPIGNIGLIYPVHLTDRRAGFSPIDLLPKAELIITRKNGTIEKYSLPIVGGEVIDMKKTGISGGT